MLTIFIENLVLNGVHGATAKEQSRYQPFRIDIEVEVACPDKIEDEIGSTVDYRSMKKIAETVIQEERHTLLETIALRIATTIKMDSRVHSVKVTIRKIKIWESGIPGVTVRLT